jgi:DNA invertase Pin-like site-specific DNA recombinase
MRTAIYTRVSTADQNPELQLRDLQAHADRQGWAIVETYEDVISGAKAARPGLNRLMAGAQAREFDCLLVWKLDRFGRSLVHCLNNIRTRGCWSAMDRRTFRPDFSTAGPGPVAAFWEARYRFE